MDFLISLDTNLFLAINHLPHTAVLNMIARGFSGIGHWGLIWIVVAILLFYREEIRDHLFFIPFIAVGAVGMISEFMIKWIIARPRPYVEMGAIILDTPGNYSFPSTHATLAFAFAYVCSHIEPTLRVWMYVLALCISFSRVYLGAHYVFDVIGGALLGTYIGNCVIALEHLWSKRSANVKHKRSHK